MLMLLHTNGHTQEVLCLHEVVTLLKFFSDEDFAKVNANE